MNDTEARGVLTLAWNVAAARERVVRATLEPSSTRERLHAACVDEQAASQELVRYVYGLSDA